MNNLHNDFTKFNSTIKLSTGRKERINTSREAVRKRIRNYFTNELGVTQPKFHTQGSFAINTALNPLDDNQVDLDDGMYLTHLKEDPSEWISPQEAHDLVKEAVSGHTQDEVEDKPSCVRVVYRSFYHLDLPIYVLHEGKAMLAHTKEDRWIHSDAKEFRDWFYSSRKDEQTSRIIRYLKAWRDYTGVDLKSIAITVFVIQFFRYTSDRDDLTLRDTVANGLKIIERDRSLYEPVAPEKDLWGEYSKKKMDVLLDAFRQLHLDVSDAIEASSSERAGAILKEVFGDRFPDPPKSGNSKAKKVESGPKPWGLL